MRADVVRQLPSYVGLALREPEEFALRWHREEARYSLGVWAALGFTAALGTTIYGMTMGLRHGAAVVAEKAALYTLAAGLAWAIPLPALYILNSLGGSKLRPSTTLLAALVTTSWGGLAMIASVPINWFFSTTVPDLPIVSAYWAAQIVRGVNLLIFTGVGVSMADVFGRTIQRLEPQYGRRPMWYLALVGILGAQLFYLFGLFEI
jgi:hypothetical protein